MNRNRFGSLSALLGMGLLFTLSMTACKKKNNNPEPSPKHTITYLVSTQSNFSILNAAVVKAGLGDVLNGTGPFTVFGPDNDAFAASGLTLSAVSGLPADALKKILLYHTLLGKVLAADVPAGPNAAVVTAEGDSVFLTRNAAGVFVNGIMVKQADVMASNGVIHVPSAVLMPPAGNIVQTAQADTTLSYLVAAVVRASQGSTNVAAVLSGTGPFTVFAPTNNAFRAAGFATLSDINNADPNTLTSILTYHVLAGRVFSSDLTEGEQATTLNGGKLTVSLSGGATVKGQSNSSASKINPANMVASNGVIHVIDQVLLP